MEINRNICVGYAEGYYKNEKGHLFLKCNNYPITKNSIVDIEVSEAGYYHRIWVDGVLVTNKHTSME